ncbi:hypothetical protein GCM10011511_15850 [Puia dinghuensis]|uniref:Uncharacterized protein n=1 Tax=Puia dinghuensis TaxID=1792502 RepID=A0A8J2UBE4_9BACT|nr:hypothetical protein GCM10011511_15850 [Puia dinghuensis]
MRIKSFSMAMDLNAITIPLCRKFVNEIQHLAADALASGILPNTEIRDPSKIPHYSNLWKKMQPYKSIDMAVYRINQQNFIWVT